MSKHKYAKLRVERLEDRNCPSPLTLPAAPTFSGIQWHIANNTDGIPLAGTGLGITDATQTAGAGGHSDAYDGAFVLSVNGVVFKNPDAIVDLTGSTVTSDPVVLSGLTTTVEYFFSTSSPTIRALYSFKNPSSSPITASLRWNSDLGSDASTIIETTTNGNNTLEASDRWLITSDAAPFNDPVLTWVRSGPGTIQAVPNTERTPSVLNGGALDKYVERFDVTVPAGHTRRLMFFSQLHSTVAEAQSAVSVFDSNASLTAAGLLAGLSNDQLAEIVNWDFPVVVDLTQKLGSANRVALGDINGDSVPDAVRAIANGRLVVTNGATGAELFRFRPFGGTFRGRLSVAVGDVNGDGALDFVVGEGVGGRGRIRVISSLSFQNLTTFIAAAGGEVRVAVGDVNGDGRQDIIAGLIVPGMVTRIRAFNGASSTRIVTAKPGGAAYFGAVTVGSADLNKDGRDDLLALLTGRRVRGLRSLDRAKILMRTGLGVVSVDL
jgi:hypothetical protein